MPFPQLPTGKDIWDGIVGVFWMLIAMALIAGAVEIYQSTGSRGERRQEKARVERLEEYKRKRDCLTEAIEQLEKKEQAKYCY